MHVAFLTALKMFRRVLSEDDGQDLVEYALVIALVALAATVGMNKLASDINNVFTTTGSTITNSL